MESALSSVRGEAGMGEQPIGANPYGHSMKISPQGGELPVLPQQKLDGSDLSARGVSVGELGDHTPLALAIRQSAKMEETVRAVAGRFEAQIANVAGDTRSAEEDKLVSEGRAICQQFKGDLSRLREKLNGLVSAAESSKIPLDEADIDEILNEGAELERCLQDGMQKLSEIETKLTEPARLFRHTVSSIVESSGPPKAGDIGAGEISFSQVCEMWRCPARAIAMTCFDSNGKVDGGKVEAWRNFLADKGNFHGDPWNKRPFFEHVRFQMFCVMEHLLKSHELVNTLERANVTPLGAHGRTIRDFAGGSMRPGELILASLLSPHRQLSLPTCTINSWINNMIFGRPWLLAKMYASALADGCFHSPGGHLIQSLQIADGRVTVDLEYGGQGTKRVFKDIDSGDQQKIATAMEIWRNEGIAYDAAAGKYKLGLPMRDLNDLCFAGIFQATLGSRRISAAREYGTMRILAGLSNVDGLYLTPILINTPGDIPNSIAKLKEKAKVQWDGGANYMRMGYNILNNEGHAFNMNIAELLALDLDKMSDGEIRCIGDLNWVDPFNVDIMRLGIRKTAEGFEFGEACFAESQSLETRFFPINIAKFLVHKTEIKPLQQFEV
jgi:hypothetical protein